MSATLHSEILAALADTTSLRPMDTKAIIKKTHHQRDHVEAALLDMYQTQQIACCKIIKGGSESIVWWISGNSMTALIRFRTLPAKDKTPPKAPRKRVCRLSPLSTAVKAQIYAAPGLDITEIVAAYPKQDDARVRQAVFSLKQCGYIRFEGTPRKFRYFPNEVAQ